MAKLVRDIVCRSRSAEILRKLSDAQKITVLTTTESYKLDRKIESSLRGVNRRFVQRVQRSLVSVHRLESHLTLK